MDISVIIVNYNTYGYTKNAVISVLKELEGQNFEVIIVDNDSKDKSGYLLKKYFRHEKNVRVFKAKENLGFAKANNRGFSKSKGRYILFLNSDTCVNEGGITKTLSYLKSLNKESIISCRVNLEDGSLDHACKRGFPTVKNAFFYFLKLNRINKKKYGGYTFDSLEEDQTGYVDAVSGAYMMMKRESFEKLNGFDEDYFMYAEDIDLCLRAKKYGIKVIYYPRQSIIHYKKKSAKNSKIRTNNSFYDSMWIYYKKHLIRDENPVVSMTVFFAVNIMKIYKNTLLRLKKL